MVASFIQFVASLGKRTLAICEAFGRATLMLVGAIFSKPQPSKSFPLLIKQLYSVGVQSLAIIVVSGLFIGMVLSLQGYVVLVDYGAEGSLGQMVALSLLRELGPVVTALLFAGRAGSALTAEISLMKATEQLSSEMMAVDPLKRVIAPRFWAGAISATTCDDLHGCWHLGGTARCRLKVWITAAFGQPCNLLLSWDKISATA